MGKLVVMDTKSMGKLILVLAALLTVTAAGCVFRSAEEGSETPVSVVKEPQTLAVNELVSAITAGESTPVVQSWFGYDEPLIEAYSFLEYPVGYGAGKAYYWGEWKTRSDNYCCVRMQTNYLPVSLDLSLGWYAAVTGISVAELYEQYQDLHAENSGTVEEIQGHESERIGDRFTFERDGTIVELLTRDVMAEELIILAIQLTPEKLESVMQAVERYPQFREFGTEDRESTLATLIEVLRVDRAAGLLDQFDYSEFSHHQVYTPAHEAGEHDYVEATFYMFGQRLWSTPNMCLAGIYDDGTRSQLLFTPEWYAEHCGHTAEELAAEFAALTSEYPSKRLDVDAHHDEYDVEYIYAYIDGVNLIRKRYTAYQDGNHANYILFSGPQIHAGAAEQVPAWLDADLAFSDTPGPLEAFLELLTSTPVPKLRARYFYNFEFTNIDTKLYVPQPFTTRQRLDLMDYEKLKLMCRVNLYDQTFLERITFNPVWFQQVTGESMDALAADFDELYRRYGSIIGNESGDGPAERMNIGPLQLGRDQGSHPEGYDTWYTVELPVWP